MRMFPISLTFSVIGLIGILSLSTVGQPIISGNILGISAEALVSGDRIEKRFTIDLYLQVRNPSNEPLILFRPDYFIGNKKVIFLSLTQTVEDVCTIDWVEAKRAKNKPRTPGGYTSYPENYDFLGQEFESLARMSAPRSSQFTIVPPDGYFEYRESVVINSGFDVDEKSLETTIADKRRAHERFMLTIEPRFRNSFYASIPVVVKKARSPYLQIEYGLSAASYKKDPGLFRTVQNRWVEFGNLPLNGDYYYLKTEPILISLP